MSYRNKAFLGILFFCIISIPSVQAARSKVQVDPYYKTPPIFVPAPSSIGKFWNIKNFGPVGLGFYLVKPNFTITVKNVEPGSPAEETGKFKKGQIIESINGIKFKDRDPRIILGDIITEAEASDGKITLKVKGLGDVEVRIPVMGSYSDTWPENCKKSDKIVRKLADLLAKQSEPKWGSALFLLSTGEEKDLSVVRRWMNTTTLVEKKTMNWEIGLTGMGICEYYLRTGDEKVLPAIKEMTELLKSRIYNGGWSGRAAKFNYMGGGHMNAAGVHCLTFLLLAKRCGVEVDEVMLKTSLRHFSRFAGRGNLSYGDQPPEGGFRGNGKTGGLALAMAAASRLTPKGESSIYAKARDVSAMKSFYATNWFHSAHTGGGIGEIWHHASMGLVKDKRPKQFRSYLDTRRWVMELSRRHDGSIGIAGVTDGYDRSVSEGGKIDWGTYFALTYTMHRKILQLYGAPATKWCTSYELPKVPWGTQADSAFQSLEPAAHPSITSEDLLNETVETSSSKVVAGLLNDKNTPDKTILKYLHHPEFGFRSAGIRAAVARGKTEMVLPLLKSDDPRLRHAGVLAVAGMFKGAALPDDKVTPEMYSLIEGMVTDPKESYWVKQDAILALKRSGTEAIIRNRDLLVEYLNHEDWWVQHASVQALSLIMGHKDHYKKIIPVYAELLNSTITYPVLGTTKALMTQLKSVEPEVKAFALEKLVKAYENVPDRLTGENGLYEIPSGGLDKKGKIGRLARSFPGGEDIGREEPKMTLEAFVSGDDSKMFVWNGRTEPNDALIGRWMLKTATMKLEDTAKQIEKGEKQKKKKLDKKAKAREAMGKKPKKARSGSITFAPEGKMGTRGSNFWSGNMFIKNGLGEALAMKIFSLNGKEYLAIERGGFDKEEIPENWHCGYFIYERVKK